MVTLVWLYCVYVLTYEAGVDIEDEKAQPRLNLLTTPVLIFYCFAALSILTYYDDMEISF